MVKRSILTTLTIPSAKRNELQSKPSDLSANTQYTPYGVAIRCTSSRMDDHAATASVHLPDLGRTVGEIEWSRRRGPMREPGVDWESRPDPAGPHDRGGFLFGNRPLNLHSS